MGYSIAIRCKSGIFKKKMSRFMKKNFVGATTLFGKDHVDAEAAQFMPGGTLSYDHGKCELGFDYSSWLGKYEREYVFALVRWMSIKVGKQRMFLEPEYKLNGKHFFYVYDGYENCPVVIKPKKASYIVTACGWCPVDGLGYRPIDYKQRYADGKHKRYLKSLQNTLNLTFKEINKIVRDELVRLNDLWKKENE